MSDSTTSGSVDASKSSYNKNSNTAPNAMNQSIYEMITTESQSSSPAELSQKISSLYSSEPSSHPRLYYTHTSPTTTTTATRTNTINTGIPSHFKYMPYPIPWRAIAGPDEIPPDFTWLQDSCTGKAAIGVFGGAVCGILMGVFLGAMSDMNPPVTVMNGREVPQAPIKEQMRATLRATGEKSLYWSRNFAFITGVFGASDCLVEKYRGTHDVWNSVISGCITGAAMQAKQGPQAAALGCGGFAAFSLVIDKVMGHH